MSSTIEFKEYISEQLSDIDGITFRQMMGEYLIYENGILFGGIYDDRLLVKITDGNKKFGMETAIPYDGGKLMFFVTDVDDRDKLKNIVSETVCGLKK